MSINHETSEKTRNQMLDRLSFLPDDILIGIISRLPLQKAIITGSLSTQWRGLWKNVTRINIPNRTFDSLPDSFEAVDEIMSQLTSPFIHCFRIEFKEMLGMSMGRQSSFHYWLRKIYDRDVRELEVIMYGPRLKRRVILPSFLFQMRSLVSLKLNPSPFMSLPKYFDKIDLPNLRKLHLVYYDPDGDSPNKLIKACPSLEELSLHCISELAPSLFINCSNRNLRRLFFRLENCTSSRIVLNTSKIEYLSIIAPHSALFCFAEEPLMLCEAKIETFAWGRAVPREEISGFYTDISYVTVLTLNLTSLDDISVLMFPSTTRLTLHISEDHDIETVLSSVKLFPMLRSLTIKYRDNCVSRKGFVVPHTRHVTPLSRSLKKVQIECERCNCRAKSMDCVQHLGSIGTYMLALSRSIDLEYFGIKITCCKVCRNETLEGQYRKMEFTLCELLYKCPPFPECCAIDFKGTYYNLWLEALPKIPD